MVSVSLHFIRGDYHVLGGVRASGTDASHGQQPAEAAAWSGTLHCWSYRLHRSGPGRSSHTNTHTPGDT